MKRIFKIKNFVFENVMETSLEVAKDIFLKIEENEERLETESDVISEQNSYIKVYSIDGNPSKKIKIFLSFFLNLKQVSVEVIPQRISIRTKEVEVDSDSIDELIPAAATEALKQLSRIKKTFLLEKEEQDFPTEITKIYKKVFEEAGFSSIAQLTEPGLRNGGVNIRFSATLKHDELNLNIPLNVSLNVRNNLLTINASNKEGIDFDVFSRFIDNEFNAYKTLAEAVETLKPTIITLLNEDTY